MLALVLMLTFCVAMQNADAAPSKKTVERVEAGLGFWGDAGDVGLPGVIASKGRSWRVGVRKLSCRSSGAGATCTYETRPCRRPPPGSDERNRCSRTRRFEPGFGFAGSDGWIATDLAQALPDTLREREAVR